MRKTIAVLSILTAMALGANAQYDPVEPIDAPGKIDVRKLRFGAFFAPNLSWMKPTASKSDDAMYKVSSDGTKVGYTWGLMIDYFFAPHYGIATGVQVNTTGGRIVSNRITTDAQVNTVYTTNFNYTLQYLEVPFQLKLRSDDLAETGVEVFGQFGVSAGINIGKKASWTVNYNDENNFNSTLTGEKEKLTGSFSVAPLLFQLNVGAGVEKPISDRMRAYVGVFFNNGFAPDVTDPGKYDLPYAGDFSDGHIRVNNFALRLGLIF